jgi:hypothetical protein
VAEEPAGGNARPGQTDDGYLARVPFLQESRAGGFHPFNAP